MDKSPAGIEPLIDSAIHHNKPQLLALFIVKAKLLPAILNN